MHRMIRKQRGPMICVNDVKTLTEKEFIRLQGKLQADFDVILGKPSSFEIEVSG